MGLETFLCRAAEANPDLTTGELAVIAMVWVRIFVDGEPEEEVLRWARSQLSRGVPFEQILRLRRSGMTIRKIAMLTGRSKSSIARMVSQAEATVRAVSLDSEVGMHG